MERRETQAGQERGCWKRACGRALAGCGAGGEGAVPLTSWERGGVTVWNGPGDGYGYDKGPAACDLTGGKPFWLFAKLAEKG